MKKYYIFFVLLGVISASAIFGYQAVSKSSVADQRVMDDLQIIHTDISEYVQEKKKLPTTLSDLDLEGDLVKRATDYKYKAVTKETYELCATFQKESKDRYGYDSYQSDGYSIPSSHKAGYQCFKLKQTLPYTEEPVSGLDNSNRYPCGTETKQLVNYEAVTITNIDKNALTITGTKDRISGGYTLCTPLTVLDKAGTAIKISDIKNGDVVTLSGSSYSKISKVQKVN